MTLSLSVISLVVRGSYPVPGKPIAPAEKGSINEGTGYESRDEQGRQPDDLHYGHGRGRVVRHRDPRAPPSVITGLEIIS